MKFILEYDSFLNEDKYDMFIALNNQIPRLKMVKDLVFGKHTGEKIKWFTKDKGLVPNLGMAATGLSIVVALIYFMMWKHNKNLDKLTPEIQDKLKKYTTVLEKEFSPKELDDLIRLISTDHDIISYIQASLDGNITRETEDYLKRKLTPTQVTKLKAISIKIHTENESLTEAEWFEVLGIPWEKTDDNNLINTEYKKLMKIYHPDVSNGNIGKFDVVALNKAFHNKEGSDSDGKIPKLNSLTYVKSGKKTLNQAIKIDWIKGLKTGNYHEDIYDAIYNWEEMKNVAPLVGQAMIFLKQISKDLLNSIKRSILNKLVYSIISYLFSINDKRITEALIRLDPIYGIKISILQQVFNSYFDSSDKVKLKKYYFQDLQYQNYLQRLQRADLNERKKLNSIIGEHLKENMPDDLYEKFKKFSDTCESIGVFRTGSVTVASNEKPIGRNILSDLVVNKILPKFKVF